MNQIMILNKLLDKYAFSEQINYKARQHLVKSKKTVLRKTLKEVGNYSIFFSVVIAVYYLLSRTGLKASLFTCKIIATGLIVTTGTAAISGTTYSAIKIIKTVSEEKAENRGTEQSPEKNQYNNKSDIESESLKGNFIVNPFISKNVSKEVASTVTQIIKKDLERQAIFNKKPLIVHGSISSLGNGYIITVKVTDSSSGEIVHAALKQGVNIDELERVCLQISKEINKIHIK